MHRLTITHRFLDRPGSTALAVVAAVFAFVVGPWGTLAAVAVLVATGVVTITWPAEQAPAQEQAPMAEEVSR